MAREKREAKMEGERNTIIVSAGNYSIYFTILDLIISLFISFF